MKVLIALNHPAHYYVFKYTAINLVADGHEVKYVIKEKDVLEKLLISEKVNYKKIASKRKRKKGVASVLFNGIIELIKQDINLLKFVRYWRPNIMVGTDVAITHIGFLFKIPSLVFNEDDYEINKLFCKNAYPLATRIVAPIYCSVGKFEQKKISYNGIQKMAYLHPKYFSPNKSEIEDKIDLNQKYFLIRLVSLTSGHDIEGTHTGITENILDKIIDYLSDKGKVYITSEDKLHSKYEKYKVNIATNKMHHLLAFSEIFIGDSQTMCAEAGLLGVPFIRYNDFVGKIEYLNDIENKYQLGFGIKTSEPEKIIETLQYILTLPDYKEIWRKRKDLIFHEKLDATAFYTWLIENYFRINPLGIYNEENFDKN